ncbi:MULTISPECIES: HlyU family transcriptional regulator [unclassified Ochrobactrum]|uniref:HlyU family transcriptional regulator n=1 Tax=unclassified Ochrobactrum TaxID=239106 RepID=UPI0015FDA992|nr:hypothetical protein [Ochrobactrum sp. RH2CCR150]MDH7787901.1 hypothetical protein [Ochrobactrum sp. 19YEA23]URQ75527.1 MAG: HlyU family transcriptional regulator [Candidatus Ochrobactrum gambitense]WEK15684.1 MAG: HlyU family transcriptional regulator [Candidatus Ochrobactrum gambitense]
MSFLKRLFGGGGEAAETSAEPKEAGRTEHKDFLIVATPYSEGGQYQVCGVISKTINGELKEYRFVRADRCPGIEDAASIALNKGRQIVDEQGEHIFR